MKVAHITTIDLSLRLLLFNQLRSLQAAGYEVVGISSPGPYVAELEAAGIRHLAVPMTRRLSPSQDLAALVKLARLLRRERFTIAHTHNPKPGLLGQLAARWAGVPIVVNTLHGFYFHDHMPPLWRRFYIQMEKIAARCSDVILSQNQEDIQTALREGICRPEQIKWLGNGIDVRRFDRNRVDSTALAQARQELGLDPARPVVGFVGRMVAEKGLPELFAAARTVLAVRPDVQFLLVGPFDAEKRDALTPAVAEEHGVAGACTFAGMRQDMPVMYALMDLFVLPSHREGFPRAPMEAAAMGVPCILTDVRGCREAVQPGRNGLLAPLGDVDALAAAILRLLDDRALAAQFGAAGRTLAETHFDEEHVFARVRHEYERLLTEKRPAIDRFIGQSAGYPGR
ncbi:MAG TPA: glycosyltransferase family 4 protein [Caldilineaceae bacterium]|nr:glycosyltransferase family 4 protein [Caldilineaceae bacterium]